MKSFAAAVAFAGLHGAQAEETNPIAKVIEMLSALQAKVVGEGEEAQKAYDDYAEWCEDTSKDTGFEIKTGKANIADLKARIGEENSRQDALNAKLQELANQIAGTEADLLAATQIREKEAGDFAVLSKEMSETVDTLGRAIGILEKEAQGGASMLQLKNTDGIVQALTALVQSSAISTADGQKLTALVQNSQQSGTGSEESEDEDEMGSPAAAVYENHSGGILDVLGNLAEEASAQLDDARKKETKALHNFEMLKQSLTDELHNANKDKDAAKKELSGSEESEAQANGELEITTKELAADMNALADLHANCMAKAQEFEAETKGRGDELTALATAKKVITEATGGATEQTYGLAQLNSFLQLSSESQSASNAAVKIVRDLAESHKSVALQQLVMRMMSASHAGSESGDPFAKVKGLIADMLEKLESEADADATEEAFCDKEKFENNEKKKEHDKDIAKLSTKIDQASARSSKLKDEVATLQKELAKLAKSKADWEKFRAEEKAVYDKDRPELEQGIEGIKTALKVLRDFYSKESAHGAAEGAGSGIISLLEVCESDFEKGLAEMIATEESAAATFTKQIKDNEVETVTKKKDVEYKTKEFIGLDKATATNNAERASIQTELDAVLDYLKQLDERCTSKVESYAETKARRDAELKGLQEALDILGGSGAAALLQKTAVRHVVALRGVRKHQ
jgi:hypothetical protein